MFSSCHDWTCGKPLAPIDKNQTIKTFLHYSDPNAGREMTVFGSPKEGLFYNYDDRLLGQKWHDAISEGLKNGIPKNTAALYEHALNRFHDTSSVDLQHIILGCNRSSGFSYLVFGYTYNSNA